jgi:23S rRNA (adenine1618-N6)-methyltransferase
MKDLGIPYQANQFEGQGGIGFVRENVWSRSARRARERREKEREQTRREDEDMDSESDSGPSTRLAFRVSFKPDNKSGAPALHVRWLYGLDHVLFESFCGMLKREMS